MDNDNVYEAKVIAKAIEKATDLLFYPIVSIAVSVAVIACVMLFGGR